LLTSIVGSRGLGLHTATAFLRAGAKKVFVSARKSGGAEGIDKTVEKLNKLPGIKGTAVGIAANVSNEAEILRLLEEIKKREGTLDILVANAGATWGSRFEDAPDQASAKILDLNVRGVFLLAQK
jgi:NAD(P)-dependent dehydrogenase (short-subunit alcohol dehydrogenase family)